MGHMYNSPYKASGEINSAVYIYIFIGGDYFREKERCVTWPLPGTNFNDNEYAKARLARMSPY